ncbi:MAG: ComEC family competence protein, partial [Gammaproteobacteria bacterium]|nr:ComEC family competence protein [Gammaproteobacteria bacterium]
MTERLPAVDATPGRRSSRPGARQPGIVALAAAALAGNLVCHQLASLPPEWLIAALASAALASAIVIRRLFATVFATFVLSACWTAWVAADGLETRWPAAADGDDVAISGWIDDFPRVDSGRTIFSLRVDSAAADVALRRVRLSWYDPPDGLVPGASLDIEARLRSPRGLVNPGAFDYERWLFVDGFDATGYVRSGTVVEAPSGQLAQSWIELRAEFSARIDALVDDTDAAALIQALALGERSSFDERHWRVFRRTGTSHLVAVSGLHIGLI